MTVCKYLIALLFLACAACADTDSPPDVQPPRLSPSVALGATAEEATSARGEAEPHGLDESRREGLGEGVEGFTREGRLHAVVVEEGSRGWDRPWERVVGARYAPGDVKATDVVPELWRRLEVTLRKGDGSLAHLELLRPLWWLQRHDVRPGRVVNLEVTEAGPHGPALVRSIADDVSVDSRTASGPVVTGTIHKNARILRLSFDGDTKHALGVTHATRSSPTTARDSSALASCALGSVFARALATLLRSRALWSLLGVKTSSTLRSIALTLTMWGGVGSWLTIQESMDASMSLRVCLMVCPKQSLSALRVNGTKAPSVLLLIR